MRSAILRWKWRILQSSKLFCSRLDGGWRGGGLGGEGGEHHPGAPVGFPKSFLPATVTEPAMIIITIRRGMGTAPSSLTGMEPQMQLYFHWCVPFFSPSDDRTLIQSVVQNIILKEC